MCGSVRTGLSRMWIFFTVLLFLGLVASCFIRKAKLSESHEEHKTRLEEEEKNRLFNGEQGRQGDQELGVMGDDASRGARGR